MLNITRFLIRDPGLAPWVKFIWQLETDSEVTVDHKLLPSAGIDIIMNMSDKILYRIGDNSYIPDDFHFNGIRDQYGFIRQQGRLKVFGISFCSYGLYPLLRRPLSDFTNRMVDLGEASPLLRERLSNVLKPNASAKETAAGIEETLVSAFETTEADRKAAALFREFYRAGQSVSVREFCSNQNIGLKAFERLCSKYTGYPPKTLQRLERFLASSNQLLFSPDAGGLTELAYEGSYYDQAHFIKEFHSFTGAAPGRFKNEKDTVKENTNYTFK